MDIRRLVPSDAAAYRSLALGGYAEGGAAFTATVAEREALPLSWWEARVSGEGAERVLGAFLDGRLVGVAGLRRSDRRRTRHKATLFGLMVHAEHRGRGVGDALVRGVLAEASATSGVCAVQLTVTETNRAAIRLYERHGFVAFGTEPLALRVGDRFLGKVYMWRPVEDDDGAG